jgi:diguanylate cyclase (GGDEF)-like protein
LVIAQVEYAPAGAPPPSSSRLTVLLNRITELADLDELRATGQTPLIEAGEKLREARGKGYAIELQLVHFGPRQAELDRLARSFNRRNLRDDVSVAIVSGTELAELKQERVRALQPTHDAHPIVEEELIEETAALRRPFDDPNHRLTMPIPRGDQLEASFEDETLTGSYELPLDDADGPQAVLVVQAGSRLGEMVRIGGALVLGRGTRASYRIDDAGISREHCSIARSGEGVFSLADLNSRNGTFVNGRRVKQALLRNGDKIRIGAATVLKFTLADEIDENFQQRMYDAALRDPLTGLYNRRHLMEQMEKEFAFSQRHGGPVSLLLLDIDHFKSLNDTQGHLIGDAVLKGVAQRILKAIRKEDLAARHGGDEFAILCRDAGPDAVKVIARRLLGLMRHPELVAEDPEMTVTVCLGLASTPHPQLVDHVALFDAADEALYRAKRGGRNRLCLFGRGDSGEFS